MSLSEQERRQLDDAGYLNLEGLMGGSLLERLRRRVTALFAREGEQAGSEFKQEPGARRLANLVNKGSVFREIILLPRVLGYVRHVLGAELKLSSLNARSADPNSDCRQPLHADMSAVSDERGFWVCNAIWLLDDFTASNGTLRIVPGSHRYQQLPENGLDDPLAPHPEEVLLEGRAGDVVVLNAHLWHGAMANETDRTRTAVHAFYARRDKPQQQYQKALLSREVQARASPALRQLLALDDPENDRLCRELSPRSGFLK